LDSGGYVYVSWVCQHTFPEHTTAADALTADAARNPAPAAAAAATLLTNFMWISPGFEGHCPQPNKPILTPFPKIGKNMQSRELPVYQQLPDA
jgi:hypothetical protein